MSRPRRPGPTVRTRVTELTPDGERRREDRLVTEEPLEIRMGWPGRPARRVWVTMRTPGHDFELAAGNLLHEGAIAPGDLDTVAYCTDVDLTPEQEFNVVTVRLLGPPRHDPADRSPAMAGGAAACGVCGKDSVTEALSAPRVVAPVAPPPGPEVVRALPERLREHQRTFDRTGGLHAAGLFDTDGRLLVAREDVGRHNAVDKVTGARLLAGDSPAAAVLVVSGRAGFELVQKAVAAGIASLVAVGAPSSLAVQLARESALQLYGFTSAERCVSYT